MNINEFRATFSQYTEDIQIDLVASQAILNTMDKLGEAHEAYVTLSEMPNLGTATKFEYVAKAQELTNEAGMLREEYNELHDRAEEAAKVIGLNYPGTDVECEGGEWKPLREFIDVKEYAMQMTAKYSR